MVKKYYNITNILIVLLIVLLPTYNFLNAQTQATNNAKMFLETSVHNFGTVKRGQKLYHSFNFKNIGNDPLIIYGVHASCGCIVNNIKPNTQYLPNQTGTIEVIFDTTNFRGYIKKHITIITNENIKKPNILVISANIKEEIWADPPIIVENELTFNDPKEVQVKIHTESYKIRILEIKYNTQLFKISSLPINPTTTQLNIMINPQENVNFIKETIYIVNNSEYLKELPIIARIKFTQPIKTNYEYIEFGNIPAKTSLSKDILLTSKSEFQITKEEVELYINDTKITSPFEILKLNKINSLNNTTTYKLSINNNGAYYGSFHGQITYTTTQKIQPVVKLNFYGFLNKE